MTDESPTEAGPAPPDGAPEPQAAWEAIIHGLREDGNWFKRKRRIMNLLEVLELAVAAEGLEEGGAGDDAGVLDRADLLATRDRFIDDVPGFLARLLDALGEETITSAEQAAFYLLSAREEHQKAAGDWIDASPRHLKAFKKFIKANKQYRAILADGLSRFE